MKHFVAFSLFAFCLALAGCETVKPGSHQAGEQFAREVNLNGLKIGDHEKTVKQRFPQAQKMPFGRPGRNVYEIEQPNPYITRAIAYFVDGRLVKLELRYFKGPGVNSLSTAGGWDGLRDYLIKKFGPPTQTGPNVPLQTEMGDLQPQYAKFNGEWSFPKQKRLVQYIALADDKGGVGVVTFVDSTPVAGYDMSGTLVRRQAPGANPAVYAPVGGPPNPGF